MCNLDKLSSLLADLSRNGTNIFAIALQEIWSVPFPEQAAIDGFNLVLKTRSKSRGGGVGFYINNKLNYKIRNDLSPFHEKEFECITVEIQHSKTKYLLSNIYRSPSPVDGESNLVQLTNFNTTLDNFLNELYSQRPDSFVFMDANINLLKIVNSNPIFDYVTTLHNNGYLQLISKATRISGDSYSLIDHILCKSFNPNFTSGTLLLDISDHFLTFLSIPFKSNEHSKPASTNKSRIFSLVNMQAFKNSLQNLNWLSVLMTLTKALIYFGICFMTFLMLIFR
jgi:hypothetical protein